MMRVHSSAFLITASFLSAAACSGGGGTTPGAGGSVSAGGGVSTGGGSSSGGGTASGGAGPGTGGATGVGGNVAGTGGATSTGGAGPESGGSSSGGASGTGGGDPGTGGSAPIVELDVVTSAPGNYWKEAALTPASGAATITVNDAQVLGPWHGFGGTFNEKGWEALKDVSEADRALAIKLLFDRADGAAFTYGRIPIGSSDYGLSRYSLNETAGDFEMENFSIARDKQDLIPYIKAALSVQPNIHFWASPWSPPTWMKSNGAFDRGTMKEDDATLGAHALYLARFVEEYEKEGIYVEAVHPQNEPGYQQDYPSCGWSGALMTKYIRDFLGPLFAERLPEREVWLGTMSNPTVDKAIVDTVMTNSGAAAFVTGIGVQWSQDQFVPGYLSSYQKPVMQTEHRCGNFPSGNNTNRAPNDDAYARESWGYIAHYIRQGVSSYLAWNMVLDRGGRNLDQVRPWAQNALLVVEDSGDLFVTPTYYVFRHVAQYVDEGASRVGTQGGDTVAWKNPDGDIVAVFYNSGNSPKTENVAIGGSTYAVTVPGQGWATVNWQAP